MLGQLLKLTFSFCFIFPLTAAEHWISATTEHFEMDTAAGPKMAQKSLEVFEKVRYFFLRNTPDRAGDQKVRVIAFTSEKDYAPYRMNAGAVAFYLQSHEQDYIVMGDLSPEHSQVAFHEYTHLIARHQGLHWPVWLEEGIADVYSSLEPKGDKAMVGRVIPGRLMELRSGAHMDWNTLFAVDHDSPYYNQPDKMQVFYAQSYGLAHMLFLGKDYHEHFREFANEVNKGVPAQEALLKVYGKTVNQVSNDFDRYINQNSFNASVYDVKLPKSDAEAEIADLSPFQVDITLADLLSVKRATAAEAQRRLLTLEKQHPGNVQIEESLGYLEWQQDNIPLAIQHFAAATAGGSTNVKMLANYALLLRSREAPPAEVQSVVEKVLKIDPNNTGVIITSAQAALDDHKPGHALSILSQIHSVTPANAFNFFYTRALVLANLRDYTQAEITEKKADSYAESPNEHESLLNLAQFITEARQALAANQAAASQPQLTAERQLPPDVAGPSAPTDQNKGSQAAHVISPTLRKAEILAVLKNTHSPYAQGQLKSFECLKHGYRLHVSVDGKDESFLMPDPEKLALVNAPDNRLEWNCGALTPQDIVVVYIPGQSPDSNVITELVF